jgi:hypothetical protein
MPSLGTHSESTGTYLGLSGFHLGCFFMPKLLLFLALIFSLPCTALANPKAPHEAPLHGYVCRLEGELKGLRLGFGLSAQFLGGRGTISCIAPGSGRHYHLPVKYRLLGAGPGFDLTWIRSVKITSAGLGLVSSPYHLMGQFAVGAASGITFVKRGIQVQSAISVKKKARGIAFELGLLGERAVGLGARLHGTVLWVKPDRGTEQDSLED